MHIHLIAPASAPANPEKLQAGRHRLEARGHQVTASRAFEADGTYTCGSDATRVQELNEAFQSGADVLLCVRGGTGCLRILPELDYAAAKAHRPLVCGYSDITALQFALLAQAGVPSLSGPMAAVEWGDLADVLADEFEQLLQPGYVQRDIKLPATIEQDGHDLPTGKLYTIKRGGATGPLIGGNLSLVAALVGTPYMPDLTRAILFLEDLNEPPYRIDGYLASLRLSGILSSLGGLAYGGFTEFETPENSYSMDEVLAHYAQFVDGPVVSGLAYGHFPIKNAIPIGIEATLQAEPIGAVLSMNTSLRP
jgi:muramoyltetrapeptide carboxypeptidase